MFSKSCEYALRSVIFIAQQSILGEKKGLYHIADAIDSPKAFTGKILQKLVKKNIVTSIKGPYGGFVINECNAKKITLHQVVAAVDGEAIYLACGLGLAQCNAASPCPLHNEFIKLREGLKTMLESNSIYDFNNVSYRN